MRDREDSDAKDIAELEMWKDSWVQVSKADLKDLLREEPEPKIELIEDAPEVWIPILEKSST